MHDTQTTFNFDESPPHPPVTLESSWYDILGHDSDDIPPTIRRQRWNQWLKIAEKVVPDQAEYWRDTEGCVGCKHHDGEWCKLMELPVTVNPYLTMKKRMGIGMACMGAGREAVDGNSE